MAYMQLIQYNALWKAASSKTHINQWKEIQANNERRKILKPSNRPFEQSLQSVLFVLKDNASSFVVSRYFPKPHNLHWISFLAPVESKYRPAGQAVHRSRSCTSSDRAETNPGFSPYRPAGQFLHWVTRNNPSTSEYVPPGQFRHCVKTSVAALSVEYLPCRRENRNKQIRQRNLDNYSSSSTKARVWAVAVRKTLGSDPKSLFVCGARQQKKKEEIHVPNGQSWQECKQDQETLTVMLRW